MKKILIAALLATSLCSVSAWAEMVNINKATAAAIQENLKGIGEKKAAAIVTYRTENGDFKALEDIKNVKGIGDGIFEKIKADISLDAGVSDLAAETTTPKTVEQSGKADKAENTEKAETDVKKSGKNEKS